MDSAKYDMTRNEATTKMMSEKIKRHAATLMNGVMCNSVCKVIRAG